MYTHVVNLLQYIIRTKVNVYSGSTFYGFQVIIKNTSFFSAGRDEDKALQWYKSSLSERRKYEEFAPEMLVAPLNNIANQSLKRGNYGKYRINPFYVTFDQSECEYYKRLLTSQYKKTSVLTDGR